MTVHVLRRMVLVGLSAATLIGMSVATSAPRYGSVSNGKVAILAGVLGIITYEILR